MVLSLDPVATYAPCAFALPSPPDVLRTINGVYEQSEQVIRTGNPVSSLMAEYAARGAKTAHSTT
jgi:hypothetical protein